VGSTDYHDTFTVQVGDGASGSAERWIREVFEGAPAPVRSFLWLGWSMFGARLGPCRSPTHVMGWRIEENLPDHIRLVVEWAVGLRANLVLRTHASSVTLAMFVRHHRWASRMLWPAVVPVHHDPAIPTRPRRPWWHEPPAPVRQAGWKRSVKPAPKNGRRPHTRTFPETVGRNWPSRP
jgi:hypothetical protein